MGSSPGRTRKILLTLGILLLLLILMVLALPLWFPWVLGPIADKYGLHFSGYERIGYQRFRLTSVSFTNQTTTLKAAKVEAFQPLTWFLKQRRSPDPTEAFLKVTDWQLTLNPAPAASTTNKPPSAYGIHEDAESIFSNLRQWLPKAILTNGIIHSHKIAIQVPIAIWTNGVLSAALAETKHHQNLTLKLDTTGKATDITLSSPSLQLRSALQLIRGTNDLRLFGTNIWHGNAITLDSQFGRQGMLPNSAHIEATSFRIPPELLHLDDYKALTGSFSADWKSNRYSLALTSHATPTDTNNQDLPPIDLELQANGDTEGMVVHRARIISPLLQFQLADEAKILFQSPYITNLVTLTIAADLARQPWLKLSGNLSGRGTLEPTFEKYPRLDFEVSGSDIEAPKLKLKRAELRGHLDWPKLEVSKADFAFADDSSASLIAKLNVKQKLFEQGHLTFNGPFGRQWLPPGYSYDNASADIHFEGPFTNLSHKGALTFQHLIAPKLKPLEFAAKWNGQSTRSLNSQFNLSAGNSAFFFEGEAGVGDHHTNLTVKVLTLKTNETTILQLEKPFEISIQQSPIAKTNALPAVLVNPFRWIGQDRSIELKGEINWPQQGTLSASLQKIDLSLFQDFVPLAAQKIVIDSVGLAAGWTNGPFNFDLNLASTVTTSNGIPLSIEANLLGNSNGISFTKALVSTGSDPIMTAKGSLPVVIWPDGRKNKIQFLKDEPLNFHAVSRSNSAFWDQVSAFTSITLQDPRLTLDVSGSWESPKGDIRMQAKLIKLPEKRHKLPAFENLQLALTLDRKSAVLDQFSLLVQGQSINVTGSVPLKEDFWEQLIEKRNLPNWREASVKLTIQNAQVSAFTPLLPTILTPEGMINADLSIVPGGSLQGFVSMEGVQTRPLGTLGPLRDIKLNLQFTNRTAQVNAVVSAGGQSVFAEGSANLQNESWLRGELPPFEVKVRGSRVPLARKPNLILRGDLDITVIKTNNTQPLVTGEVRLVDSFFLQNLRSLVPGRLARPDQRPPYFSIETPLLADWRLDLNVVGNRFMRIRDPLFVGEASSNLKIVGTLKNPIALGDVRIDSGTVQFPFGNLQVTSGFVTLTSENPYRPQLNVSAGARQFGYDIRVDITGPADEPLIQFSSIPSLSSEQILLMLTAGELPRNDFSLSPQQRMQRLAMYLGKNFLSQYGFGDASQRLTIRSGQDISYTGRETYVVEYRLSERWSLVGEYDRFGDFNAGLKWLIYSK